MMGVRFPSPAPILGIALPLYLSAKRGEIPCNHRGFLKVMEGWLTCTAVPPSISPMGRIGLVLCALLASAVVSAAVLQSVEVTNQGRRYELLMLSQLSAPREAIFGVLTDYEQFGRISRIYTESGYLDPAPDGTPMVYTTIEGCVLFFCKSGLRRVELLETREPSFIRTVTLPEHSDFRYGVSQWDLEPDGDGTLLTYHMEMEPDFWVPPVIGPWILKQRLESGGRRGIKRIERLALENGTLGSEH